MATMLLGKNTDLSAMAICMTDLDAMLQSIRSSFFISARASPKTTVQCGTHRSRSCICERRKRHRRGSCSRTERYMRHLLPLLQSSYTTALTINAGTISGGKTKRPRSYQQAMEDTSSHIIVMCAEESSHSSLLSCGSFLTTVPSKVESPSGLNMSKSDQ